MSQSSRLLRTLAFACGALGLVAVTYTTVAQLTAATFNPDAVFILGGLASLAVGILVANQQPTNVIAWLLIVHGTLWSVGEAARFNLWLATEIGPQPLEELSTWIMMWIGAPAWLLVVFLVAYFPGGRVETRWLRPVITTGWVLLGVFVIAGMLVPGPVPDPVTFPYLEGLVNPWAIEALGDVLDEWAGVFDGVTEAMTIALLLAVILDLGIRWRRSTGVERLQMRWFGFGVLVTILLLVVAALVPDQEVVERLMTTFAINSVPIAIGIAVARFRLYEINRLVSRTVTYALVVGFLAVVYTVMALAMGSVLPTQQPLVVAISTLAAVAAFNPLRRRIHAVVDRRFNRARYDAERVVDVFAHRLRIQVDGDVLDRDLIEVVSRTMQPASAALWVRQPEDK